VSAISRACDQVSPAVDPTPASGQTNSPGDRTPLRQIIAGALLAVLAATSLFVIAPVLVGLRPAVIASASMAPALNVGDIVYAKSQSEPPRVGDIVLIDEGEGTLTHRVIAVGDGWIQTKGDANPVADGGRTPTSLVLGTIELVVPKIGRAALTPTILLGVAAVTIALFLAHVRSPRPPRSNSIAPADPSE